MPAPSTLVEQAREYDRYVVGSLLQYWVADLLQRAAVQPDERVLDVACGTGIVSRGLAKHLAGQVEITGLDLNPAMISVAEELAAAEGASVVFTPGNALELPFPDDSYDVVLCQQGLQFMPDKAQAVAEMRRVLKPGGRAVISVWQGLDVHPFSRALKESTEKRLGVIFADPHSWGDATVFETVLRQAGFEHVKMAALTQLSRWPEPDQFVRRVMLARAAAMTELRGVNPDVLRRAIDEIENDMADLTVAATQGNWLVESDTANIASVS